VEADFVAWLQDQFRPTSLAPLGLMDDAAWIRDPRNASLIITTDMLCEGVHFEVDKTSWERIGRKSLAVNLSDLAAMAAEPQAAFLSLTWPHHYAEHDARRLVQGLLDLAREYNVILAGGDTNRWSGGVVINVTIFGHCSDRGPLTRTGAQVGDMILVTGPLGGSLLGHQFDFTPRVALASYLQREYELHAGMDISDGLSVDLDRLTRASRVGGCLQLDFIPITEAAQEMSRQTGHSALHHALSDGEDFELLLTAPPTEVDRMLGDDQVCQHVFPIGTIISGDGLWFATASGTRERLAIQGYLH
jgi:thiamine-monophosphate kinase